MSNPTPNEVRPEGGNLGAAEAEAKKTHNDIDDSIGNVVPFQHPSRDPSVFWALVADAPDMSKPFLSHAPRYWNMGLPVIPLAAGEKRPVVGRWQQFGQRMPTEEEHKGWLAAHPEGNIGLPLGPCSGLVALDIDIDNPDLIAAIEQVAGTDLPWRRVGSKGYVTVFRYNSEKTFRIKDAEGAMICELLSLGTQIVIPPSIHPDTGRAYIANVDIVDAKHGGSLVSLPADFEQRLRDALVAAGALLSAAAGVSDRLRLADAAGKGGRDVQLSRVAGACVRYVARGELSVADAVNELLGWLATKVEQTPGDEITEADALDKFGRFLAKEAEKGGGLPQGWDAELPPEWSERFAFATRQRPVIHIIPGELPRMADEVETALADHDPPLYQRGGRVVKLAQRKKKTFDDEAAHITGVQALNNANVREAAMRVADFEKYNARAKADVRADCPLEAIDMLVSRREEIKLPELVGFTTTPTIKPDGGLITTPGYDERSGILYAPTCDFPSIPDNPTRDDAKAALTQLLDLVRTFDFVDEVDRAGWVSLVLTGLVRATLPTAPLHAFSATCPGSGKSLLVRMAALIVTGEGVAVVCQPRGDEELVKRLETELIEGSAWIAIDNCDRALGGGVLNAILTAEDDLKPRVLGKSEAPRVSSRVMFVANGNGFKVLDDSTRRVIISRLDPKCERPELRGFEFNPLAEIKQRRPELVAAALTILRAYHLEGNKIKLGVLQSFEAWSRRVRDPLVWLGMPDVVASQDVAREEDPDRAGILAVLGWWQEVIGEAYVTANEVSERANEQMYSPTPNKLFRHSEFRNALLAVTGGGATVNTTALGKWLGQHKGRRFDGLVLEEGKLKHKVKTWRVATIEN